MSLRTSAGEECWTARWSRLHGCLPWPIAFGLSTRATLDRLNLQIRRKPVRGERGKRSLGAMRNTLNVIFQISLNCSMNCENAPAQSDHRYKARDDRFHLHNHDTAKALSCHSKITRNSRCMSPHENVDLLIQDIQELRARTEPITYLPCQYD